MFSQYFSKYAKRKIQSFVNVFHSHRTKRKPAIAADVLRSHRIRGPTTF